ncbi:hypothetical protein CCACVL1_12692 [Corchorus capsularis]|uniref:Uncharacterized protein n=1 Tax=Corchorus capsularis TaxID=210143 RepID=A0A1R3IED4_COCAP|nr:hypothetical protein CCACVL1_12692 [Corchorus capsularis]
MAKEASLKAIFFSKSKYHHFWTSTVTSAREDPRLSNHEDISFSWFANLTNFMRPRPARN